MFNQKVIILLRMWLNGRVLSCHAQHPGFKPGHQEKERGRRGGGEKKFYRCLARLYLQTPSIESFTRFASVSTQRPHSQKNNFPFLQKPKFQENKNIKKK
jgi:hypothetical protein